MQRKTNYFTGASEFPKTTFASNIFLDWKACNRITKQITFQVRS